MKLNRYILILIVLIVCSCEEKTEWDFKGGSGGILVVEGILTNENKQQEVILSRTVEELNSELVPLSGATVTLSDGSISYLLTEDATNKGRYITGPNLVGVTGKRYTLSINDGIEVYDAETYMRPVSPGRNISFQQVNDSMFTLTNLGIGFNQNQAMFEYTLDWSNVQGYTSDTVINKARIFTYNFNAIETNQIFKPSQQRVLFPAGTIIVGKKYSLTPEHADFLRALVAETEWRGGFFDAEAANLPTNLTNGAIGFYGASSVLVDTVVVQ